MKTNDTLIIHIRLHLILLAAQGGQVRGKLVSVNDDKCEAVILEEDTKKPMVVDTQAIFAFVEYDPSAESEGDEEFHLLLDSYGIPRGDTPEPAYVRLRTYLDHVTAKTRI